MPNNVWDEEDRREDIGVAEQMSVLRVRGLGKHVDTCTPWCRICGEEGQILAEKVTLDVRWQSHQINRVPILATEERLDLATNKIKINSNNTTSYYIE